MRRVLLIGACLFLAGAVPALAQERTYERRVETTTTTTEVRRASDLLDTRVSLEGDTALGKVVDLVINDRGCIDYLIVRHEDDYLAIPWGVITYEVRERRVVVDVNISRERLREVTFRKDHWPNFYGREFTRTVHT